MKTFKQFISETTMADNELKDLLEHDCEYFLNESSQQGFLVRGMRKPSRATSQDFPHPRHPEDEEVVVRTMHTRTDRQPSDTSLSTHKMLDQWYDKNFGFKARSQAVFCMGSSDRGVSATKSYGDPYIIMPIGKFKYVWSSFVTDLYVEIAGVQWNKDYEDYEDDTKEVEPEDMVDKFLSGLNYTDKRLDAAVLGRYEVMVACSKYYAIGYEHRALLESILDIT